MSKKWTRRSALALIGSGAGLLTWGTGGFTDVTADRQVNIETADNNENREPLLGITTHDYEYDEDDQVVFETETPPLVTLTNNTGSQDGAGSQFDEINVAVQDNDLDFNVQIVSEPDSLGVGKSGKVTAKVTELGSECTRENVDVDLKITASATAPNSAPEIIASRTVSLSLVNCINFQDSDTQTPSGFIADIGDQFGPRVESDSDWTVDYGWQGQPNGAKNYNEDGIPIADQTHNHFEIIDGPHPNRFNNAIDPTWEIGLPSGWYDVTMHCQDPLYYDQEYSFDVDGGGQTVQLRDNKFDNADEMRPEHAQTYSFPVEVEDSRLRITPPDGTYNPKISWLRFNSRGEPDSEPVDISAKGANDKRGYDYQDYYFSITHTHDSPIEFTHVRVDFARTGADEGYIEPDLLRRADGKYEVEMSVGENLEFNNGRKSINADYTDDGSGRRWYESWNSWEYYYNIGDKIPLESTSKNPKKYQLDSNGGYAELGLFAFREDNGDYTSLLDMTNADVHITLWYEDDDGNAYNTTTATLSDPPDS